MDFGKLIGGVVSGADPLSAPANIATAAQKILSMFKMDKNLQAQIAAQATAENIDLEKVEIASALSQVQGQLEINKAEAASPNWFIAGWRPFIGWSCGVGFLWAVMGQPFAVYLMALFHWQQQPGAIPLPAVDLKGILELLVPMLGLGALRTAEKITGSEGNR
jgi:hypothetical protein